MMIVRSSQVWGSFTKRPDVNLSATSLLKSNKAVSSNTYEHIPSHRCTHKPQRKCTGRTEDRKCYIPETDSETGTLLWAEQRECSLCPWSVDSQEPFMLNSYHIQRKALGAQDAQVQRRGHSVQQEKSPHGGFTFRWSWLGISIF